MDWALAAKIMHMTHTLKAKIDYSTLFCSFLIGREISLTALALGDAYRASRYDRHGQAKQAALVPTYDDGVGGWVDDVWLLPPSSLRRRFEQLRWGRRWKLILSSRCIGERPMDTYDKRSICDEVHVSINVLGGGGRHEIRQRSWGV